MAATCTIPLYTYLHNGSDILHRSIKKFDMLSSWRFAELRAYAFAETLNVAVASNFRRAMHHTAAFEGNSEHELRSFAALAANTMRKLQWRAV